MNVVLAYPAFTDSFGQYFDGLKVWDRDEGKSELASLLIFSGGEDINPALYKRNADGASGVNEERDEIEVRAFQHWRNGYFGRTCKVLGVCRGLQFLAAMYGFSLVQDLYSIKKSHRARHEIRWLGKTPLTENFSVVNSMHHQAVDVASPVLGMSTASILAVEPETLIPEVMYWYNNIIGVQFHPEFMPTTLGNKFFDVIKTWAKTAVGLQTKLEFDKVKFDVLSKEFKDVVGYDTLFPGTTTFRARVEEARYEESIARETSRLNTTFRPYRTVPTATSRTFSTPVESFSSPTSIWTTEAINAPNPLSEDELELEDELEEEMLDADDDLDTEEEETNDYDGNLGTVVN